MKYKTVMMQDILSRYDADIHRYIESFWTAVQRDALDIMRERFGLQNVEEVKEFAKRKQLALAWDQRRTFLGVTVNNRWLYTTTGQVIGKQGKRWMIEKIKQSL